MSESTNSADRIEKLRKDGQNYTDDLMNVIQEHRARGFEMDLIVFGLCAMAAELVGKMEPAEARFPYMLKLGVNMVRIATRDATKS